MPIICMDSKTFLRHFIKKEKDDTILEASYLIASNKITIGRKAKNQAQIIFYPSANVLMKLNDDDDVITSKNSSYVEAYFKDLDKLKDSIADIIRLTLKNHLLTIILTTEKEERALGILKIIQMYVSENFGYEILRYKKDTILPTDEYVDQKIISRCNKIKKKEKNKRKKRLMKTEKGQERYFSTLGKKKLKSLLKKEGLYRPGMDEAEMIDVAMIFLC